MKMREPLNTMTHFVGVLLSIAGLITLMITFILQKDPISLVGSIIFGLSMIALYTASTVYHWYDGDEGVILKLRKLDHAMIFILIAGTYTPICLIALKGPIGNGLLISIWSLAIIGIVTKLFFINMPRWLSAGMYLLMGWLSILVIAPLFKALPLKGFIWLVTGGVLYTIGSLFYASKSKIMIGQFGFHEIFHVFIMAGTLAHFILVQNFLS